MMLQNKTIFVTVGAAHLVGPGSVLDMLCVRGWKVQPVHVAEFADALWDTIEAAPRGRAPDVAGPQVLTWPEVVAAWRAATGRCRPCCAAWWDPPRAGSKCPIYPAPRIWRNWPMPRAHHAAAWLSCPACAARILWARPMSCAARKPSCSVRAAACRRSPRADS
jgi:hypothetical protein